MIRKVQDTINRTQSKYVAVVTIRKEFKDRVWFRTQLSNYEGFIIWERRKDGWEVEWVDWEFQSIDYRKCKKASEVYTIIEDMLRAE